MRGFSSWALVLLATSAIAAEPAAVVGLRWGESIPLRDGVKLNATVYQARGASEPVPCVFTLTPYISQSYHDRGKYFAANGYVFLTVDARGRGNSEGEFTPLLQETRDTHDVAQWLARQPYCNGKVSMWGGSYAGYNQWTAAMDRPAGLATIVPVASPYPGVDFPMAKNMFYSYDIQWLQLTAGKAAQDGIFGDGAHWKSVFSQMYTTHAPFRSLDSIAGLPSRHFQDWVAHPQLDAYWDSYVPTPAQYAALDLPILSITGMYDGDQPGALMFYRQHMQHGSASAKARHFLVIGPWDHPGTRTPKAEFAGLKFGEASLVDMNALHKAWYDWTLKDGAKPEFLKNAVAYYVTGAETWRYADSLDGITGNTRVLHLDSTSEGAHDLFAAGFLDDQPARRSRSDAYRYDPLDLSAFEPDAPEEGLNGQSDWLRDRDDRLIYHSKPFTSATELSGFFQLKAWISLDQPDTDIAVGIYEIKADGTSILLSSDGLRARYRNSPRSATPVQQGKAELYDFNQFTFASRQIAKGSRLRLVIGAVNSPYAQKNYNSGGEVSDETAKDARTITVTLHHDRRHPSTLSVPLGKPEA